MNDIHAIGPGDLNLLLAVEPGLFDNAVRPDQSGTFLASADNLLLLAFKANWPSGWPPRPSFVIPTKRQSCS